MVVTFAELPFPALAHNVDQQPGDRIGIERVDVRGGFAGDFAAVFQLPGRQLRGWVGEMLADHFIFPIAEFGLGTL